MKPYAQRQIVSVQLRSFADFCQRTDLRVFHPGCLSPDDFASIAKIEKFLKAVMVEVTKERVS